MTAPHRIEPWPKQFVTVQRIPDRKSVVRCHLERRRPVTVTFPRAEGGGVVAIGEGTKPLLNPLQMVMPEYGATMPYRRLVETELVSRSYKIR